MPILKKLTGGLDLKVPLLDLSPISQDIHEDIMAKIEEVILSSHFILGPEVLKLENQLAELLQCEAVIGMSSGTDALLAALMALEVGQNDIVITTPYSFFATAGVIARLGGIPTFVDINPTTFNLDPMRLEAWFHENKTLISKVKAIIPVNLYGQSADLEPILSIANEYGIPVIEDAAQSLGATYPTSDGRILMSGTLGTMGTFSFFPTKNLGAFGDAGAICTNDLSLRDRLRKLRVHGSEPKYFHSMLGGNFRIDALQAAVLRLKLPYLEKWNRLRKENARYYMEKMRNLPLCLPVMQHGLEHHIFHQFVVTAGDSRDDLRTFLKEREIGTEVYYPCPFHLQECFSYLGLQKGAFPESEKAANQSLALPVYPGITQEQLEYVVMSIHQFYER